MCRSWIYFLSFLCYLRTFSDSFVILYHTENSPSLQQYDCIYYTNLNVRNSIPGVKYCRQLSASQPLERNFSQFCHHGGRLWSFKELLLFNISVADVSQWNSSFEQTDRYSKYLLNNSLQLTEDDYICQCTNPSSFGKFCEYEFYRDSTSFDEALTKQFVPLENFTFGSGKAHVGSQLHENRPCYVTWTCDSGLMCLDWRHICDGKQQCMDGLDEDYCESLEFNECEDDEYRCANGMCIPDEYWLDGSYDCMDWTDERGNLVSSGNDCFNTFSLVCDEHLCPYNQWSCGDGQCVPSDSDRHTDTRDTYFIVCQNLRDINYICESITREFKPWWTINNGYCLPYSLAYQNLGLDSTASWDACTFSVKCALSNGLDRTCTCRNAITCLLIVFGLCQDDHMYYPASGPIFVPYIRTMYARVRDWNKKKPDRIEFKGRAKCIGYQSITDGSWLLLLDDEISFYEYMDFEYFICTIGERDGNSRNNTGPRFDVNCWNSSKTFNNHFYQVSFRCSTRCLSKYRIRDGINDCFNDDEVWQINNSCSQIQHHRFQCSSSELTCMLVGALGNWGYQCSSKRDEWDAETNTNLYEIIVNNYKSDPVCAYLRKYIQDSSKNITNKVTNSVNSSLNNMFTSLIPFRSYCDSFFDTMTTFDESPEFCDIWICFQNEYRCLSGQCIPQDWLCDGEWDCGDGSDEQRLFVMDHLNEHNSKFLNLTELQTKCHRQYRKDNTPFSSICNISSEYPCYRTGIDDIFNVDLNRPCINLTQIGDGKTDCLTALDERNRLKCSEKGMLGYSFRLNDHRCILYLNLCESVHQLELSDNIAYNSVCPHQRQTIMNETKNNCDGQRDAMCLNHICIKKGRCNGVMECFHGEDEYGCLPQNQFTFGYRGMKEMPILSPQWPIYPSPTHFSQQDSSLSLIQKEKQSILPIVSNSQPTDHLTRVFEKHYHKNKTVYEIVRDVVGNNKITFENHYLPFICNRGLAVKYHTGHTVCFCSASFYGPQCEYHSDRITVVTHLDLNNYRLLFANRMSIIKVLVTFLFKNKVIDYYEFRVDSQAQIEDDHIKQRIYFVYPRREEFLHMKRNNRSGTQLYSVRFEAFNLGLNDDIEMIGVWKYSIYWDQLPSFRLAKILRFPSPISSSLHEPCLNHSCSENGLCQKIINTNDSSYFCSCKNGYYGTYCEHYDQQCRNFCSPISICRPKYRGILTSNPQYPLCLCPLSIFGDQCYLKSASCIPNPCLNGGSCSVFHNFIDIDRFMCHCDDLFEGNYCERRKELVHITFDLSSHSLVEINNIAAATVTYNNYEVPSFHFNIRHQQAYLGLPSHLKLFYNHNSGIHAPNIAVLKVYGLKYYREQPNYYILYLYDNQNKINITIDLVEENHCPFVETLWHLLPSSNKYLSIGYDGNITFNSTISIFFYHRICQAKKEKTNATFTCFRDMNYLCVCDIDHYRAECFLYNRSVDQCSLCLSNGYCLKGEFDDKSDFVCLCPRCSYGKMCQYSNEFMSFTLDSLIIKDIQNSPQIFIRIYIFIACSMFLFGLFNNFNSFSTFLRQKPRKSRVGNYLLIISIVDQCSLLLLLFKVIHIILGSNGTLFSNANFNRYTCKILSYLLSVSTRITYWLTSLITIERLSMVFFPTPVTPRNSRRTVGLITLLVLFVLGMHVHEVIYYTTVIDLSYTSADATLCVSNYVQSYVSTYNRINTLIHYFVPFLMQTISITVLIVRIALNRARTSGNNRGTVFNLLTTELKTQKEQYLTPIIIVLNSLPQIILSFSFACVELKQSWQRYLLLTTYFLSYLPQMLGFILYVLPSTAYSEEFRLTAIGKRLMQKQQNAAKKTVTPTVILSK